MRLALSELQHAGEDEDRQCRAWKLFLLLTRMLLIRNARGGFLPKGQLQERFHQFFQGRWIERLIARRDSSCRARQSQSRRRRTQVDSLERRAERAEALVHLGELSAGRHALERAPPAPGNDQTRAALTDATRRPQSLRSPLQDDLLSRQAEVPFQLSHESLLKNLKSSKRGWPIRHDSRAPSHRSGVSP